MCQPSAQARTRVKDGLQENEVQVDLPVHTPEDASQKSRPRPRIIAFYLPQFHQVPENDVFWGEGFTEWSHVVRGRPLFPGHYQPRIPADLGFYDLRLPEVRQAQANLARDHGVHGFCYYHYWFEGRRVLERPFEEVLESGYPDFPFCLCWANHDWKWRRSTHGRARLIAQRYSEEDDRAHIRWLLKVFEDDRYIKVNGRPLFLIYRSHSMPDPNSTFATWREEAQKAGVAEPYLCKVDSMGNFKEPAAFGCDAAVEFWPHGAQKITAPTDLAEGDKGPHNLYEYRELVEGVLQRPAPPYRRYPCVVPDWDNTARVGVEGLALRGSTPELYGGWLEAAIRKVSDNPPEEQLVFVNAWNEWSEATYLEPDIKHGRAYLEATRRALHEAGLSVEEQRRAEAKSPGPPSTERLHADLLKKYKRLQLEYTELLAAEEQSPLFQESERRVEDIEQRFRRLQHKHRNLLERQQTPGDQTSRPSSRDVEQLVGWMRQMDAGVSALLTSRRWRLSSALMEGARRMLLKPREKTVEANLLQTSSEFRSWLRMRDERDRDKRRGVDT